MQGSLDVAVGSPLRSMPKFDADQLGRIGIDDLVDGRQDPQFHKGLDDHSAADGHPVGQLTNRNRLWNDHIAHDFRCLDRPSAQALFLSAAIGCFRTEPRILLVIHDSRQDVA